MFQFYQQQKAQMVQTIQKLVGSGEADFAAFRKLVELSQVQMGLFQIYEFQFAFHGVGEFLAATQFARFCRFRNLETEYDAGLARQRDEYGAYLDHFLLTWNVIRDRVAAD